MRTVGTTTLSRKQLKTCLNCGHDGPELQGERGQALFVCPCCGQDLYARPPRSYAEMEGLDDEHWGLFAGGLWRTAPDGQGNSVLSPVAGLVRLVRRLFGAGR
jgi:predicted RNA-binding Zn-ribbon protein involved in translation (DUF1610 family)